MIRKVLSGSLLSGSLFVVIVLGSGSSRAQDPNIWPAWRGPNGTGANRQADPPTEWSAEKNIQWRTPVPGRGHSTPIVWKDQVFVTTAVPVGEKGPPRMSGRPGAHDNLPVEQEHEFVVVAIDRGTGKVLWNKAVHRARPVEGGHRTASLASASPATDGELIYASFGSHGIYCLDFSGNVVWSKRFGQMHTKHGHGEGSSPVLFNDLMIVNWDHEGESFLVALEKKTGKERWRRNRSEVTSWSTPLIVQVGQRHQLVVCGTNRVRGYDPVSGETIWECGGMSANIVASPVAANGIVYVGSSYEKRALMAIRLEGATGDITSSKYVLWTKTRGTPYVPSPLLVGDALYYITHYQNILTRIDGPSGADSPGAIRLGVLGNIYASPVASDKFVYVTDVDGVTIVINHSDIPRLVAINEIGEGVNASLALAGNQLFLRGERHLFCISRP